MRLQQVGSGRLNVDRDHNLADLVSSGQYSHVNPDVLAAEQLFNQPVRAGEVDYCLFSLAEGGDEVDFVQAVVQEMHRKGLRPANMRELLSFGVQHPHVQEYFSVVACGGVEPDECGLHRVPCLRGNVGFRHLGFNFVEDDNFVESLLLAVPR